MFIRTFEDPQGLISVDPLMSQDEKLDEALKGTFPASDAFYLSPDNAERHPEQAQVRGIRNVDLRAGRDSISRA